MDAAQTMRADARKNYEALVAVAQKHLTRRGVSTSLEAIAKEAGVGAGTLYRHFPDRDHLVYAALNAQGEQLRADADRIRHSAPEEARLARWLDELETYLTTYQGLPDSVAQAMDRGECNPLAVGCQEMLGITEEFLEAAKRHGAVRESVTAQGLFDAALALAWLGTYCPPADEHSPDDAHGVQSVPVAAGDKATVLSRLDGLRALLQHGYVS